MAAVLSCAQAVNPVQTWMVDGLINYLGMEKSA